MMVKTRHLSAFSLIEIAIVLIILGLILGLTIPMVLSSQKVSQRKITQIHQEQIIQSLASYVLQYSKFPGAASQADGKISPCHQGDVCFGYVPYKELGLSESVAKDGFGRWFSYAVHSALTRTGVATDPTTEKLCRITKRAIRVRSTHNQDDLSTSTTDPIAIVLISHGENGGGALLDSGDRLPACGYESINSQNSSDFYEGQSPENAHHVFWITRNNFMAIYAKTPCMPDINIGKGYSNSQRQTEGRL